MKLLANHFAGVFGLAFYSISAFVIAETPETASAATLKTVLPPIGQILTKERHCSDSIWLRAQALNETQQRAVCEQLAEQENAFHQLFHTQGNPVADDYNQHLRVNVYASRDDFVKYAGSHFNMPTDNGGMYLEGLPGHRDNQAEFVTYQKNDQVWNLRHEYVHYLDGRFNLYGDFCQSLHDSHSPPENCPSPSPLAPHTVWWSEGIAEYLAWGEENPRATAALNKSEQHFSLSQLFDTSYEQNGGTERVYFWGYFAVRFMIERHRNQVEAMLKFLRHGDFPRYQAIVRSWGQSFDREYADWLKVQLNQANHKA